MKIKGMKSLRMKLTMYALLSMVATICIITVLLLGVSKINSRPVGSGKFGEYGKTNNVVQPLFENITVNHIAIFIICSLIIFAALFVLISYDTIYYLKEIIIGIERMKNGDMEFELRVEGEDELAVIANSINEMRIRIASENETKRLAEQTKDELITNVAHDLRTPLTSVIGYLDLVRRDDILTPAQQKKYIGIAYDKAKSLETLIKDLFDYTRYNKDKVKIHQNVLDLNEFMTQLVDEFYPSFTEKGLICMQELAKESLFVYGDGELLARAIGNLMSNAIKYGADGKQIEIYTEKQRDDAVVKVVNYGRIIPKDDLDKIFDKFYRVEGSRSLKTGGTGLGLAIAKNIVELHDGKISAKSGISGTIFQISLPLYKEKL